MSFDKIISENLTIYDFVIVTHIPTFYKVNLYNELAKKTKILVIFIAVDTLEKRASDFVNLQHTLFEYQILCNTAFQSRNKLSTLYQLFLVLKKNSYKKILLNGWDLPEFWFTAFISPKNKNCLALESTIIESDTTGIKGKVKKIFLSLINTVFASGNLHIELLSSLTFRGKIMVTKGVGIINKPGFSIKNKLYDKNFLFIGRLSAVKNLEMLVKVFNSLPEYKLTIIGDGEEKKYLNKIAAENINFVGSIENSRLKDEYLKHDIFILPSTNEPWGLVVEEALYFGLPVIVSQNCGSCELIEDGKNGYIIDPNNFNQIRDTIKQIDVEKFNMLSEGAKKFSINEKDEEQIEVYIQNSEHAVTLDK